MTATDPGPGEQPGRSLAAAYENARAAILTILSGLSGGQLSTVIPACPAWTIRDLIAHMTGVAVGQAKVVPELPVNFITKAKVPWVVGTPLMSAVRGANGLIRVKPGGRRPLDGAGPGDLIVLVLVADRGGIEGEGLNENPRRRRRLDRATAAAGHPQQGRAAPA